jgi:hypothetical protein
LVAEDLLKKLYKKKSLRNIDGGFEVQLTNPLSDATIIKPAKVSLGDEKYKDFTIEVEGTPISNQEISERNPDAPLAADKYTIKFTIQTEEYGELKFRIKDRIKE